MGYLSRVGATIVLCVAASTAGAQQASSPPSADPALIERGRYLVEVAVFCGACHATRGPDGAILPGKGLAGGRIMADRGFRAVVPNITPDPETGIGRWTEAEVATAIREGRRPNGSLIGPPMPIDVYRHISDRDLAAIVAYLRTVPPVRHAITERSTYPFPLEAHGPQVANVPEPPESDPVTRGAYLAGPLAHCTDCHTPPLPNEQRDWSRTGAGGVPFEGPWGVVVSRNITPHREHGIGAWTDEQIVRALLQGVSADGRKLTPPMSGRTSVWAQLSQRDLGDLVAYLRSLPPQGP
jgi:mono/diheme cytochrome c family protein